MQILITLIVSVTLMEMMFAMGLRMNFTGLAQSVADNSSLVVRALLSNYLVIPAITLIFLALVPSTPTVATAFLILAVCPGAPYGPPFTAIARGNFTLSVGLMVILAGSSAILAPVLLYILVPLISPGNSTISFDAGRLIGTLFFIQLLPLGVGLSLRQWKPVIAERLVKPASHASKVLNTLMVIVIASAQFRLLGSIGHTGLITMVLLLAGCTFAGWMIGWPGKSNRRTLSIVTSLRNMSLAMVIAAGSFPGVPALTAVLAYAAVAGTGLLLLSFWWRIRPV